MASEQAERLAAVVAEGYGGLEAFVRAGFTENAARYFADDPWLYLRKAGIQPPEPAVEDAPACPDVAPEPEPEPQIEDVAPVEVDAEPAPVPVEPTPEPVPDPEPAPPVAPPPAPLPTHTARPRARR